MHARLFKRKNYSTSVRRKLPRIVATLERSLVVHRSAYPRALLPPRLTILFEYEGSKQTYEL